MNTEKVAPALFFWAPKDSSKKRCPGRTMVYKALGDLPSADPTIWASFLFLECSQLGLPFSLEVPSP